MDLPPGCKHTQPSRPGKRLSHRAKHVHGGTLQNVETWQAVPLAPNNIQTEQMTHADPGFSQVFHSLSCYEASTRWVGFDKDVGMSEAGNYQIPPIVYIYNPGMFNMECLGGHTAIWSNLKSLQKTQHSSTRSAFDGRIASISEALADTSDAFSRTGPTELSTCAEAAELNWALIPCRRDRKSCWW